MTWISIKDKMPEERVDFGNSSNRVIVAYIDPDGELAVSSGQTFYHDDIRYWDIDGEPSIGLLVTHWMPLPEPPKG
jgi:hypothetical protein